MCCSFLPRLTDGVNWKRDKQSFPSLFHDDNTLAKKNGVTRKWGKSSSFQLSDTDGRGSVQLVQLLYRTECNKLKQVVCVEHDFSCAFSNVCIEKRLFLVRKLEISVILWLSSENLSWVILLLRNASFTCTFSLTVTYHETAHQPASDRLASHNTEPEVPNFFFFLTGE